MEMVGEKKPTGWSQAFPGSVPGSFGTHTPNPALFVHRDVPAGLHRGLLLPGSEEVQDAATARAGGLTDRPV